LECLFLNDAECIVRNDVECIDLKELECRLLNHVERQAMSLRNGNFPLQSEVIPKLVFGSTLSNVRIFPVRASCVASHFPGMIGDLEITRDW
jgi:hypothetical protein